VSIRNSFTEKIILPLSDIVLGNSVAKHFQFLQKSQWWSKAKLKEYQNNRLRMLINHSVTTVPYYSDLFKSIGLNSKDIQSKDDLKKIPILTKLEIKKQGADRFISSNYPKNKIISASSSGSTGEPLYYYETKESYSMNIAANLRGWYWMGYKLGDKYIKLSQNSRINPIKRIQDKVSNNRYLSTSPLIASTFNHILREIEKFQPKVIRCYPDPLLFLARHKKLDGINLSYNPLAITTTGNTLYPEIRDEIEDAFGCKVFDSYSCEGNSNLFECNTHDTYHSSEEYGISEILDEESSPIENGIGRLISTDLYNLAHPFIRYDTQDYVEISASNCKCKRNLLPIKKILGRDSDTFETPAGKFIVHDFTIFFSLDNSSLNKSIDSFQIINREMDIIMNLKVNNYYNNLVNDYIKNYWQTRFKKQVTIQLVNYIAMTKSGKRKFIINE